MRHSLRDAPPSVPRPPSVPGPSLPAVPSLRDQMRERGIPARDIFPPLPSQAEIWREQLDCISAPGHGAVAGFARLAQARTGRLPLPTLPLTEILTPLGIMTLSLLS